MSNFEKRKAPATKQEASQNKQANPSDNSSALQRQKLLAALRKSPMSTLEIRRELDILGVAPRIFELKARGYKIITHWVHEATDSGNIHKIALYVLLGESGATV